MREAMFRLYFTSGKDQEDQYNSVTYCYYPTTIELPKTYLLERCCDCWFSLKASYASAAWASASRRVGGNVYPSISELHLHELKTHSHHVKTTLHALN
jgi:hypothetical protein